MNTEDAKLLHDVLALEKLTDDQRAAFAEMLDQLESGERFTLSKRQREWAQNVLDVPTYENLASSGKVARGREVETPDVLKRENLPMKPPGRR